MGCDIHLRVQARREDGSWHEVPATELGSLWSYDGDYSKEPARSRNYWLFARLAGVRNDSRGVEPLFADRGCPEDLAPTPLHSANELAAAEDPQSPDYDPDYAASIREQEVSHPDWDGWEHQPDYHSHTWATLAELLAADWTMPGRYDEYAVSPDVYRRVRDDGYEPGPFEYLSERDLLGREVLTAAEYAAGEAAEDTPARADFVRRMLNDKAAVRWQVPATLQCSGFVLWARSDAMAEVARAAGGADRVRVLIAFDN